MELVVWNNMLKNILQIHTDVRRNFESLKCNIASYKRIANQIADSKNHYLTESSFQSQWHQSLKTNKKPQDDYKNNKEDTVAEIGNGAQNSNESHIVFQNSSKIKLIVTHDAPPPNNPLAIRHIVPQYANTSKASKSYKTWSSHARRKLQPPLEESIRTLVKQEIKTLRHDSL